MSHRWLAWLKGRTWLQFSLRTFLVFITIACVWLAYVARQARLQREAIQTITELGGTIYFDYQQAANGSFDSQAAPTFLLPLQRWIGEDFFRKVVAVSLPSPYEGAPLVTDADLVAFRNLPHITDLSLELNPTFTSEGMQHLTGLRKLRRLTLENTNVGAHGIAQLPRGLKSLNLSYVRLSDEELGCLEGMSKLSYLRLNNSAITDIGLEEISRLSTLQELNLDCLDITDAGVEHLKSLKNLGNISLYNTDVTDKGVAELRRALPYCSITPSCIDGQPMAPVILWPADYRPTQAEIVAKIKEAKGSVRYEMDNPTRPICQVGFNGITTRDNPSVPADVVLRILKELPNITDLNLEHITDVDRVAKELPRFTDLRRLTISRCRLSDDSLEHLGKLTNLIQLNLECTRVSDARLDDLTGLKNLVRLELSETRVTQRGREDMKRKMPHCDVRAY